jgi:hypothetical protein
MATYRFFIGCMGGRYATHRIVCTITLEEYFQARKLNWMFSTFKLTFSPLRRAENYSSTPGMADE